MRLTSVLRRSTMGRGVDNVARAGAILDNERLTEDGLQSFA